MKHKVMIALNMPSTGGRLKLGGILRYIGKRQTWDITILMSDVRLTAEHVNSLRHGGYDGLIASIPLTDDASRLLAEMNIPVAIMDFQIPLLEKRAANLSFIYNSSKDLADKAAMELLKTGRCRTYAFVHYQVKTHWSRSRCENFRDALRQHDLDCEVLDSPDGLETLARPVGILAANDECGFKVLEHCLAHGMRIPDDAAVIGVDNDVLMCENTRPPLSSIQPDFEEEGFIAARETDRMMSAYAHGRTLPMTKFFTDAKQMVCRESTAPISPAGIMIQKAATFIRKNAFKDITADDVAKHLHCSRRLADLRFRELRGTTIGETLIGLRLEEAKRLLKESNEPIVEIARRCGYSSAAHLMTLFHRRVGKTMGEYRRR